MQKCHRAAFLAFAPLFIAACSSLPPWDPVPTGQTSVYAKIETNATVVSFIAFSGDADIVAVSIEYSIGRYAPRYALLADGKARAEIREICTKYFDWRELALDNNVEIVKEIRTITLPQVYRSGSGWDAGGNRDVSFVFSSQKGSDNDLKMTLRVQSRSFFGDIDQFILNEDQVRSLSDSLSETAVAGGYQAAKKRQDTIDMFN